MDGPRWPPKPPSPRAKIDRFCVHSGVPSGVVTIVSYQITAALPMSQMSVNLAAGLVVTSLERARDLPNRPVIVEAAARGSARDRYTMLIYYRPELWVGGDDLVGRQLWRQSGLTPDEHPNRRAV